MVAAEFWGDMDVAVTIAEEVAPVTEEFVTVTVVVVTAPLGDPSTKHPLPMSPFLSVFNTHISALPAPKEEVSPARI